MSNRVDKILSVRLADSAGSILPMTINHLYEEVPGYWYLSEYDEDSLGNPLELWKSPVVSSKSTTCNTCADILDVLKQHHKATYLRMESEIKWWREHLPGLQITFTDDFGKSTIET